MAKRSADVEKTAASSTSTVPIKKSRADEPVFPISTSEEMNVNILKFQNKKLGDRLIVRQKLEADLRQRIETAEKKQTSAEAIVYVINRYWNQLNEDVRILLQRFDAETSDEVENNNESDATTSLLAQLANWDSDEMSEQLQQRVDASTRAITKVVQAFDRIVQRNAKVTSALNGEDAAGLDDAVRKTNIELTNENKNLNFLTTQLHEKCRSLNIQLSEMKDRSESVENSNDELQNRIDEMEFELNRLRSREMRLEQNLQEAKEKIWALESSASSDSPKDVKPGVKVRLENISQSKLDELQKELEEHKELSSNRLMELETMNAKYKETLMQVEKLKMDLQCIPPDTVKETAEYKCLQSHFSVLYNESMQLKSQLDDNRNTLQASKNNHLRQIEHMESEELSMQKRLRNEVIQLEDHLSQARREYEMLRLEFSSVMAQHEQTVPLNREMRHLITSLQSHNSQMKTEANRLKKKLKDANHEVGKLRYEKDSLLHGHRTEPADKVHDKSTADKSVLLSVSGSVRVEAKAETPIRVECDAALKAETKETIVRTSDAIPMTAGVAIKKEPDDSSNSSSSQTLPVTPTIEDKNARAFNELKAQLKEIKTKHESLKSMYDVSQRLVKDLKKQLAEKGSASVTVSKSAESAAGSSAAPSALSAAAATTSNSGSQLSQDQPAKRLSDDPVKLNNKIRVLEKMITNLKQQHQQQEEALLNEMEVTGTAFENMQEMNLRMIQQAREKDDANFKLMSERIKSQQIQKLLKEEKESLTEQVIALNAQVEAQNQVVRKLEEKERLLQNNLSTIEKELACKQQAMELHKRKAIEAAQSAADLKLHLDKYLSQLKEAQGTVAEKTSSLHERSYKITRLQEEITSYKRKYERAKKFELAATADEVLLEEIREYKSQLTCPSCQARRKDAVLTRCFHVFCYECLKTRYESRQRKCPKCTLSFGPKDFHRLYLA